MGYKMIEMGKEEVAHLLLTEMFWYFSPLSMRTPYTVRGAKLQQKILFSMLFTQSHTHAHGFDQSDEKQQKKNDAKHTSFECARVEQTRQTAAL